MSDLIQISDVLICSPYLLHPLRPDPIFVNGFPLHIMQVWLEWPESPSASIINRTQNSSVCRNTHCRGRDDRVLRGTWSARALKSRSLRDGDVTACPYNIIVRVAIEFLTTEYLSLIGPSYRIRHSLPTFANHLFQHSGKITARPALRQKPPSLCPLISVWKP